MKAALVIGACLLVAGCGGRAAAQTSKPPAASTQSACTQLVRSANHEAVGVARLLVIDERERQMLGEPSNVATARLSFQQLSRVYAGCM